MNDWFDKERAMYILAELKNAEAMSAEDRLKHYGTKSIRLMLEELTRMIDQLA